MSLEEVWKDIPGYEGAYQVSNFGKIKSLDRIIKKSNGVYKIRGDIIKVRVSGYGYYHFQAKINSNKTTVYVHVSVALAFIGQIPDKYQVNHIDGNKTNNHVSNLEIISRGGNLVHAYQTGLRNDLKIKDHHIEFIKNNRHLTQIELANLIGVSQTTIWRRIKQIENF